MLLLVAVSSLGLLARTVGVWRVVFDGDVVRLLGADSYYHLRQALFCVRHFPEVQRFDTGTNFPLGENNHTAGLYDWFSGFVALTLGARGAPDEAIVPWVLSLSGPIFAMLAFAGLLLLANRVFGYRSSVCTSLLLVAYPGEFLEKSSLGFADHHVLEVCCVVWGLQAWTRLSRRTGATGAWRPAVLAALPWWLLALSWNGAPLYLAILLGSVGASAVWRADADADADAAARRALLASASLALGLGTLLLLPGAVPWVETHCFSVLISLGLALWVLTWPRLAPLLPRSSFARWSLMGGLGGAALLGLSYSAPEAFALAFLPKTALVAEQASPTLLEIWGLLGPSPVLALWAFAGSLAANPNRHAEARVFVCVFALAVVLLWVVTGDYGYLAAVLVALLGGKGLSSIVAAVSQRAPRLAPIRNQALALPVMLGAFAPLVEPCFLDPAAAKAMLMVDDAWAQALRWVESNNPGPNLDTLSEAKPGADFDYSAGPPGILSMWDYGNAVAALARRPVVASQRTSWLASDVFLATSSAEALRLLAHRASPGESVSHVIVDSRTMTTGFVGLLGIAHRSSNEFVSISQDGRPRFDERFHRTLGALLLERGGSTVGRFRLVYDSPQQDYVFQRGYRSQSGELLVQLSRAAAGSPGQNVSFSEALAAVGVEHNPATYDELLVPRVRVFEVVPGAVLVGQTSPKAIVHAIVGVRGQGLPRRAIGYSADADDTGAFRIQVAQATGTTTSDTVRTDSYYQIFVQTASGNTPWMRVRVPLSAVLEGRELSLASP